MVMPAPNRLERSRFAFEATTPPYSYQIVMTIPNVRFEGTTPNVSGPDVLDLDMPFTGLYDGTNSPLTIQYYTTDVAD